MGVNLRATGIPTACGSGPRGRHSLRPSLQQLTAAIQPRLAATLHLPQHPDTTFEATVATTSNAINQSARTLLVELHAANPEGQLLPGAYAQATWSCRAIRT